MSLDNFSLKPVPQSERKGAIALIFVMLGLTFFSASMWTGGTLGTALTYDDFWTAVIIGNLMLGLYTSALGYIGAKTGLFIVMKLMMNNRVLWKLLPLLH